eukprot:TRINITY_DN134_c0_g2_i1.p2 TRINITY_DN134_c0_g2~~TRINITY_DN134_c0_g2_i1.p2  ORF type:complete len:218 (-),score=96.43 TRINITY_DN134_c0_g2_i1:136-693(-)
MFCCAAAPGADSAETIKVDETLPDKEKQAAEAKAAEAAKKQAEEEQAKKAADEAAAKKADEEAAAKKAEEEAAAKKKAEEEAAAAAAKADVEFVVELVMDAAKTPIGIELKQPTCVVKSLKEGALTAKYNAGAADAQKVAVGDKLIGFSFKGGSESTEIIKSIQSAYKEHCEGAKMTLKFTRAGK